jgi:hypothetical protein
VPPDAPSGASFSLSPLRGIRLVNGPQTLGHGGADKFPPAARALLRFDRIDIGAARLHPLEGNQLDRAEPGDLRLEPLQLLTDRRVWAVFDHNCKIVNIEAGARCLLHSGTSVDLFALTALRFDGIVVAVRLTCALAFSVRQVFLDVLSRGGSMLQSCGWVILPVASSCLWVTASICWRMATLAKVTTVL